MPGLLSRKSPDTVILARRVTEGRKDGNVAESSRLLEVLRLIVDPFLVER